MTMLDAARMLTEAGYEPAPDLRSFGGDFCLRAPDGRVVWEKDFIKEVDALTKGTNQ